MPQVIGRGRRIVVLARADWPGVLRLREALDELTPGWVAVGSATVDGVDGLSSALAGLVETLRAAERVGRPGWIEHADDLAVERLLLLDESLLRQIVDRELGPLIEDPRMGGELVDTLRVYFDAGENMRETARRLHLAPRTVAYRLERIEELLGRPLEGELRSRLSIALLAHRALGGIGSTCEGPTAGLRRGRSLRTDPEHDDPHQLRLALEVEIAPLVLAELQVGRASCPVRHEQLTGPGR